MKLNFFVICSIIICILFIPAVSAITSNTSAYDSYLVYLIHANGTEGGFVFTDEQGHHIERYGNTYTDTYVKQLGSASAKLDGVGDYLSTPYSSAWTFGSGNFTVMWWENRTAIFLSAASIGSGLYSAISPFILGYQEGNTIYMSSNGAVWDIASGRSLGGSQTGTSWNQFVVTRAGNNFYAYRNGVQTDTWTSSAAIWDDGATNLSFGSWNNPAQTIEGHLDEIAIWKGVSIPIADLYPMPYEIKTPVTFSITSNFTISNTTGFAPLLTHFTDTSTNVSAKIDSWNWSFGDGNISSVQNPDYTYENVGVYTVNLTITNTSYSLTSTKLQNVNVLFINVDFTSNATSGYPNDYFQFNDTTNILASTWNWSFGDGGTSTIQNPVHQYIAVGSYDVSLNVTNSTSFNSTTKLGYITISPLPAPSNLIISANKTYSTDSSFAVLFNTTAITPQLLYRNLSFGDGAWYNTTLEFDNSTAHTYTTVGNYAVALYETNAAGTAQNSSSVFVVLTNPTLSMHPPDIGISRGLTGVMTLQVSNLSHVDGGATNITFNQTAVNIVSITGNTTASQNFTITSAFDNNAGTASIGISCIDVSSTAPNVDIADIVWRANTTRTNDTAPINFNSTAFTSFVKSNSTYNGFRYPNITYLNPGIITLTDQTWTRTLYFKNAYNLNLISGIQVRLSYTGVLNGSATTNAGTYVLSSTYGTISVVASADGYYNVTQDIMFSGDGTDTFLMTPLSGAPGQTTWYIPQQVRIYAVNSMGSPIEGVYVTCRPLNFTAPETWTQILIGIQPSVNISGTTLDGWTGTDGSWVAPMLSSFRYEFHLVNTTLGVNHTVRFNPLDTSYRIYVNTASQPNNTLLQVAQSSLPYYKLNNSGYYNLSMIYQDALGYTQYLQFNVKDYTHGNALVYTKNWTNPGTGIIVDNYTVHIPLGQEYNWQYNATKV